MVLFEDMFALGFIAMLVGLPIAVGVHYCSVGAGLAIGVPFWIVAVVIGSLLVVDP